MAMPPKDLLVLVADKNMEATLAGLLSQPQKLGIAPIQFDIRVHPRRDAGCRSDGHQLIQSLASQYRFALVLFDREGCGQEHFSRVELETNMESRLSQTEWENRAVAVVFDPELEIWVWSESPHVASVLGWNGQDAQLRLHLEQQGFLAEGAAKPHRPKEAVEEALKVKGLPRSSARYRDLAEKVSYRRCTDPAFLKFKQILQTWFA